MKVVLFTQRVEIIESYGERRDCADRRISDFLSACGLLPVPVPNNSELAKAMVMELKPAVIVLTGGNSLVKYGGSAPERDATDLELIRLAINKEIPLYGFCRGMQSILDYFGCELTNVPGHVAVRHDVTGLEGTVLVNSFHNQGCINMQSDELEVVMQTSDGVIEKIKHTSLPIVGTMWHPEREDNFSEYDVKCLKLLIGDDNK